MSPRTTCKGLVAFSRWPRHSIQPAARRRLSQGLPLSVIGETRDRRVAADKTRLLHSLTGGPSHLNGHLAYPPVTNN